MVELAARDVSFSYERVRALEGVTLELAAGELVCVLGPNGSGKSTLLRLCAGLLAPDAGRVELDGADVARLTDRERARRIAVVPQSLAAVPEVTVGSFVLGGRYGHLDRFGRARAGDHDAVRRALVDADAVGLEERLLAQLSGGQRQRVLVARALAQQADVLLVDEPTSSLDPQHQLAVFELVAGLTRAGRAVLVVTHDMNLASQFATRLVLLDDGRVRAVGGPVEVLRREVLEPVYGPRLRYGTWPGPGDVGERPYVVPWAGPRA